MAEEEMMNAESEDWLENVRMLTESAGAIVPKDGTLARIRAARFQMPGYERAVWTGIAELGWLGLRLGEASGGLGLGAREGVALAEVLGRGLVAEPVLPALFALSLLERAGGEIPQAVLSGEVVMVAAWQAGSDDLDPCSGVSLAGGTLSGRKIAVAGGSGADLFAVTTPQGMALVPRGAPGLTINTQPMHDGTFLAQLDFAATPCTPLACPGMDDALHEAMLMHAGYLLGLSERAFEITLDYLRIRKQFGVAIGSFQALQHRATDIKVHLDLARASVQAAAAGLDQGRSGATQTMAVFRARNRAGALARLIAREAVQMHGAIGYTDEADIGLFTRKAMAEAGAFAPEFRLRAHYMALRETLTRTEKAA